MRQRAQGRRAYAARHKTDSQPTVAGCATVLAVGARSGKREAEYPAHPEVRIAVGEMLGYGEMEDLGCALGVSPA
jgi:hypothetical protein